MREGERLTRNNSQHQKGFSLPEVLIATLIFMIIMGVIASALISFQKRYQGEEYNTEVTDKLRSTIELITYDIGQSGAYQFKPRQIKTNVSPASSAQNLALSDASGLYAGELLTIDAGFKQEIIKLQNVSLLPPQITATVVQPHLAGAAVLPSGPFAGGTLAGSSPYKLQMFGDTAGNGTLNYLEYVYAPASGLLTRSSTPIIAGAQNPRMVQLQNMVGNPGGTPVFAYQNQNCGGTSIITHVVVTLTVRTSYRDPQTMGFKTQTASVEVAPRNATAACRMAIDGLNRLLEPQPPGVPLP
jgi:type II secretory pathway pseudopilin PulG